MDSSEAGGPSPQPEDTELKLIFDNEIALERKKRSNRIVLLGVLAVVLVIALSGMFLASQPPKETVPGTIPPQVPPPATTPPLPTPSPETVQPTVTDREASTKNLSGVINGGANPGFPYWASGTITYRFDSRNPCDYRKTTSFLRAFKIIDEKTGGLVSFVQSPDGALSIGCHDSLGAMNASGWASPWISPSGLIAGATIDMYQLPPGTYECDSYPTLEMHIILQVLGFEDTSSADSLMYSGIGGGALYRCRELDAGIVNCLMNIYSNGKRGQACTGILHK